MHCVDLGESFPTKIYLQNLASIQPITSPIKSGSGSGGCCRLLCGSPSFARRPFCRGTRRPFWPGSRLSGEDAGELPWLTRIARQFSYAYSGFYEVLYPEITSKQLWKVRSRQHRNRVLERKAHFAAFFKVYKIDTLCTAPKPKCAVFLAAFRKF